MSVLRLACAALLMGCSEPPRVEEAPAPTAAHELVESLSFDLVRPILQGAAYERGPNFALVDAQVVRLLDGDGYEIWGRRLPQLGALRALGFCLGGLAVSGEAGTVLLGMNGLLQAWPDGAVSGPAEAITGDESACVLRRADEEERISAEGRARAPVSPGEARPACGVTARGVTLRCEGVHVSFWR